MEKTKQDTIQGFFSSLISVKEKLVSLNRNTTKEDVLSVLLDKNYRVASLSNDGLLSISKIVGDCLSSNESIPLVLMVGGYKQFGTLSYPNPSLAEIFNFSLFLKLIQDIEHKTRASLQITYRLHNTVSDYIDKYPESDLEAYQDKMTEIADYFNSILIKNGYSSKFKVEVTRNLNLQKQYIKEIEEQLPRYIEIMSKLEPGKYNNKRRQAHRNIYNYEKSRERYRPSYGLELDEWSMIANEIYLSIEPYISRSISEDEIQVYFRTVSSRNFLQYRNSSSWSIQYWAGEGILRLKQNMVSPWILPKGKINELMSSLERISIKDTVLSDHEISHALKLDELFLLEEKGVK